MAPSSMMQFYLNALALLAPTMVVVGAGFVWGRRSLPFAGQFISQLVTQVATPALVFHTLMTSTLDNALLADVVLLTLACMAAVTLVSAAGLKLAGLPVRKLLPTTSMPNAGNIGLPVSYMAFGETGLAVAVAIFTVSSFLQHTVGLRILPGGVARGGAWRNPTMALCVLAVLLRALGLGLPDWSLESARLLGSLAVPLMLLSLGHALSQIPASGLRAGSLMAGMRLIGGCATALLVTWAMGAPPLIANAVVLQMSMPCAVMSYMYARTYTDRGDEAAGAVLVSTGIFLVFAPILLWFLRV
ncbi:AEC family transporter [Kerstersia gyiorum]|uniref:Transporter n=1 Tax=Kerstersia gyiorum TaxID=206506 RepID=A0A4Q7N1J6_9BURK|nr:AEC family transporter [Kerstersia gyiorum]KAB0544982.1 AEC family transporter [Kerstersia gyiorum]MCP1632240.1 putative permease [Kerstersia gyiorum]MCP1635253.1 putative permease [Kerstersia gyiorum]MCP1669820.1 putative permease [Kerstersia gyiorum]MCP1681038.1 putative permease [Kerstersia gyiorum]